MSDAPKLRGRIAAIFDLDGTLIPEPSLEWRFSRELRRNKKILAANYLCWAVEALRLLSAGLLAVQHGNRRYLTGIYRDLAFRYVESISFFSEGIARVAWHARQGHEIVLLSGTLEPLAHLAAIALEYELEVCGVQVRPRVCATRLAEKRDRWTGYVVGEVLYGAAKVRALAALAAQEGIDLRQSHAYGNSLLDRYVLCTVGHAHAVNPSKGLEALANEKHWPVWHWRLDKQIDSPQNKLSKEIHHVEERA
ncbi:MAG: haloacid dehalogenase-like hydrolase [Candidatus Acidiferrum sp.]